MAWNSLISPLYPWARTIDRILTAERPPDLSGPTIYVASDYGGCDKNSLYETTAVVCSDLKLSVDWERKRRIVRRNYLADGRRMAYKSLGDRQRAHALVPFLQAAEYIHGLCLVTVVSKSIRHLCLNKGDYERIRQVAQLKGKWKDPDLEAAMRITHLLSCILGGLSRPGHNIYWISDQDGLFANNVRHKDMARLAGIFSSCYVKHALGEVGLGTTVIDEGDRMEEDLASVCDLVAGATAEVATCLAEYCGGAVPYNLAVRYSRPLLPKAKCIADWLWRPGGLLKRVAVLFDLQRDGRMSVSRFRMEE